MAKYVEYNGEQIPFADNATPEQMKMVMMHFDKQSNDQPFSDQHPGLMSLVKGITKERKPLIDPQNVGAYAMKGAQNIAALLGEGGQTIASMATGGRAPQVNVREEMGLGHDRPVDLGQMLSKNPNMVEKMAGQYMPAMLSGGSTMGGQALATGAYGMTQRQPEDENLMLPGGRVGGGIEEGIEAFLAGKVLPKAIGGVWNAGKKAVNYLRPGKDAQKFVESLSGAKNAEGNIAELGERVSQSKEMQKSRALGEKSEFMQEAAGQRVIPSQAKPLEQTKKTLKSIGISPTKITDDQNKSLTSAMQSYIKTADVDKLVDKVETIFDHPGLSDAQISKLEDSITLEQPIRSGYQKMKEPALYGNRNIYNETMMKAHDAYMKNPTIRNADTLQSKLFNKQKQYYDRIKNKSADDDEREIYQQLKRNRASVLKDMKNHIDTMPEQVRGKYDNFRNLWREEVGPYTNPGRGRSAIREMASGESEGVKPESVGSAFRFPNKEVKKILEHIGEPGKRNVLFNELNKVKPGNARSLANAILDLQRKGGYNEYVTKEMSEMAKQLLKRANLGAGAATLGGLLVPGAIGGAAYKHYTG